MEPARSSILNPKKRIVDLTISSESSVALPESPVKLNPVPVEIVPAKENPAKMDSIPASSKTTQAEEPRVPESTKKKQSMEIEQLDRPDISPPKESQIQPKETVTEPASLPEETEETKMKRPTYQVLREA